ncbi:free fatty acid receptor 4 isoform X2 [Spea bombifrons]|uniref:free fatty acid receptor 4 isoform X2 n=1 Tax=Spea bombifrons TaxID=233779 RepID=UPI00234AC1D8|nr:free fatty acid receptor 4 isoform X2 [Spea bombifrons]
MDDQVPPSPGGKCQNGTCFLFFSDFKSHNKVAVAVVETLVLLLVFGFSLLTNICAIVLLARRKRLVTANCFVLNLFCADLLFISMIPFILVIRWTEVWVLGDFICHMLFYIICLSGCVTLISLSAVSLERMVCIMKVTQATTCNAKVVAGGLLGIWGFSAITALPLCLFFQVVTLRVNGSEQDVQVCTLVWPTIAEEIAWDISFIMLDFLVPGLSIVISYTKIFKITKAMRERLITSTAYSENHQLRVSQRDYKLFRTLFLLMVSFFIMWTPVFIIVLLLLVQNLDENFTLPPTPFFWVVVFTFCNSIVNPVLYNINLFKQKWWQIIFCCSEEERLDTDTVTKKNDTPNVSTVVK